MNGIEKNLAGVVKNFYNVNLIGILGLGWAGGGKLDWQHYCFEIGASKVFNNSIPSPTKYGKCPSISFKAGFGDWDSQMEGNWKGKITALR